MELLSDKHLRSICKIGKGKKTCRYLGVGRDGFECLKGQVAIALHIDARVEEGTMNAEGDNCDGC